MSEQETLARVARLLSMVNQDNLATFMDAAAARDRRTTELLEANNREVERRRAAERLLRVVLESGDVMDNSLELQIRTHLGELS